MTIGTATAAEPSGDDKAAVVSLVREIVKDWSNNNIDAATRYMSPSVVLTDSTAPYFFRGPTAVSDWLKSYAAETKANDITDAWETLGKPNEVEVDGPHAYVTFPAVYGFKQHGKPVRVKSTVTVALEKSDKDWSILSWTWSKR
jgi:ketosteroid isomerase-like protein